ncbi:MAG: hypothetical protein IJ672_01070 [Methanobrevibacter sp.]|nr:hypothetical protein [Methanobrevibacter sp.]
MTLIGVFIAKRLKNSSNRYLNPEEFLPSDEIHTLRQLAYLILMAFCFINILYSLMFANADLIYFAIFDIALSLFIAVTLDKSSIKNKILWFLLIPYGAFAYTLFGLSWVGLLDILHVLIFIYLIKMYFDSFMEYTQSNGLGITIILLFSIIFVSFFITQIVEDVNPLDSMVMVSNAFTSNGYTVLGHSIAGKINSIFLVWGGYIISGAGTATLTATILLAHFNRRIKKLEKLIEGDDDV